ncbi:TetR/AcrR family transcriptional regulator [Paenibacillus periandrae]|uniref:TetR/AcrR family transcriptional regulator n=1 Tax=Paenibacillus periandrae TaxID=1761741 RepID=UPI001F09C98E|nr:TetR/AcrR family transcriptional regulator [Paenibacillus periandrae]
MTTGTKVDRRILKTKEAINKAFLELFSEKEFEQITINDIADRANVNRGTIYLHYTDKYDLLYKCIDFHLSKMFSSCTIHVNLEKDDFISEQKPIFKYFEDNFLFFSSMISNKITSLFQERMLSFVKSSIKKNLDQSTNQTIDKELVTQFNASAFVGIIEWWIQNKMPHSPQYMAEQMWDLFKR